MDITVVGAGYVGLVTAAGLAELGHTILCVESDLTKLAQLNEGKAPFYEPELDTLVKYHSQHGNLKFSDRITGNTIFICVGTPSKANGETDLSALWDVVYALDRPDLVVIKSTVPVGTTTKVAEFLGCQVAHNPEFLREGSALWDFLNPDRIVVGTTDKQAARTLQHIYDDLVQAMFIVTDPCSSELSKYASNAMLATRISFINEIADICDATGANIRQVAFIVGADKRIGSKFLNAGCGYGGSCFPKDLASLQNQGKEHNLQCPLIHAVQLVNKKRVSYVCDRLERLLGTLEGKRVAILGVSFKPNTNDVREAPSIRIYHALRNKGVDVAAHDPVANVLPSQRPVVYDVLRGAHAACLVTEWDDYSKLDWRYVHSIMRQPVILDCRNFLDQQYLKALGFDYLGLGVE